MTLAHCQGHSKELKKKDSDVFLVLNASVVSFLSCCLTLLTSGLEWHEKLIKKKKSTDELKHTHTHTHTHTDTHTHTHTHTQAR